MLGVETVLDLRHGGDENANCKPNYVSVMNYSYEDEDGIPVVGGQWLFDFSPARLSDDTRPPLIGLLNELFLDEADVLAPDNDEHLIVYVDAAGMRRQTRADRTLDYSGDRADPPFESGNFDIDPLDRFDACVPDVPFPGLDLHTDHDDWAAVTIGFRESGKADDAALIEISDETGMLETEEQGEAVRADAGRTDLQAVVSVVPTGAGFDAEVGIVSLDRNSVQAPRATIELSPGVTVTVAAPQCTPIDISTYDCAFTEIYDPSIPTAPVQATISLIAEPAAIDPSVTVTATSLYNNVDNDPDPSNNVVTVALDEPTGPPVAADDSDIVEAGDDIDIDVLSNDTDPDDDIDDTSLTITEPPQTGTATVIDDGSGPVINYLAPSNGSGTVTIGYEICDLTGLCDTATVTIQTIALSDCTLVGTPGDDIICARAGNDTISGNDGDDIIIGGRGSDTITGGDGDDILVGGRGGDDIRGQAGNDTIRGRRGSDTLRGGAGDDLVRGGRGDDTLFGGAGSDELRGGKGSDTLRGGGGNDTIHGGRQADDLHGNSGDDMVVGGRGSDHVRGGSGRDVLLGRRGNDLVAGGTGDDDLRGGRGNDELDGGPDVDSCRGGPGTDTSSHCESTFAVP